MTTKQRIKELEKKDKQARAGVGKISMAELSELKVLRAGGKISPPKKSAPIKTKKKRGRPPKKRSEADRVQTAMAEAARTMAPEENYQETTVAKTRKATYHDNMRASVRHHQTEINRLIDSQTDWRMMGKDYFKALGQSARAIAVIADVLQRDSAE